MFRDRSQQKSRANIKFCVKLNKIFNDSKMAEIKNSSLNSCLKTMDNGKVRQLLGKESKVTHRILAEKLRSSKVSVYMILREQIIDLFNHLL